MDAVQRLSALSGRRQLVARFYRMHRSAERAIGPWLTPIPDLDYPARRRSAILAEDLGILNANVPEDAGLPGLAVAGQAEALGFLYVLEGSALGGRMIRKALIAKGCGLSGLSFLDPHGAETGARWRSFLAILEREGASDPGAVTQGGVRGFAHARACLLESEVVP